VRRHERLSRLDAVALGVVMVAQEIIETASQTLAALATDPVKIALFG
jgi:hypothetical protein